MITGQFGTAPKPSDLPPDASPGLITGQFGTAPKPILRILFPIEGLITGQFGTAPKPRRRRQQRQRGLITGQFGTAPKQDVRYGEYRGLSYIEDGLKGHEGDGSELDPIKMIVDDTGFSTSAAKQVIADMYSWTGEGYSSVRKRQGAFSEVADRIEGYIAASPKYRGTVWRGIGVEREVADGIIATLTQGQEVDQLGISSWSTELDWAQEFGSMNQDRLSDGVKIIFRLDENMTGVSIKHVASAVDNDEVIASANARYILNGDIDYESDPYDGDFVLIPVKEA